MRVDTIEDRVRAFVRGLSDAGFDPNKNVTVIYQWANNQYDRLPELAADLVRRKVDLIVATSNAAAVGANKATADIPIVFYIGIDPVQIGLVPNLNHPGGTITGIVTVTAAQIEQKRVEVLHQAIPTAKDIAYLVNPTNKTFSDEIRIASGAAQSLGLKMHVFQARSDADLEQVFAELKRLGVGGLVIAADLTFFSLSKQLAALANRESIPAIHQFREFAAAGGLMSYGSSFTDSYRQLGVYAGRVLNGEKPGDLPVQQTTKVDLVLNLRDAKALGITLPLSLLGRADEVIE